MMGAEESTGREWALQIGLTGSIGMGKTTLASQFNYLGFPVFDADASVHRMYSGGGSAVKPIEDVFPGVVIDGVVDRKLLGALVLSDSTAMSLLEAIVHPLVQQDRQSFLQEMSDLGHFLVIYDIPLLYEKPATAPYVDYTIVASADAPIQRQRVLDRPGMSAEKFESILAKQMPDEQVSMRYGCILKRVACYSCRWFNLSTLPYHNISYHTIYILTMT